MEGKCEGAIGCRSADLEISVAGSAVRGVEGDGGFDRTERRSEFSKLILYHGYCGIGAYPLLVFKVNEDGERRSLSLYK